ncbi:MAG: hypothetical protein LAN84_16815 [Acidobacteriia bacterium]|nr:hypothetical protein [Terriglobia bacterium]
MPNPAAELSKRRSTRIVQAVPLMVTGVDALGRPFQERTSTLIINCHGCRYQSKHYVLKNMWVTLEIPHPETGHAPRVVRGRVAWIQRPRTVRQLFQVAIELDVAGNVWGIAFPPEDWFAFPDAAVSAVAPPALPAAAAPAAGMPAAETPPTVEAGVSATAAKPEQPAVELPMDNLRVFPAPTGTDASLQLARQMTRLLNDAKQQIQAAAHEAARQAVAEQERLSMREWQAQFAAAREELSAEIARAGETLQKESAARARAAQSAAGEALQAELPRWIAPQVEQLTRTLSEQFQRESAAQKSAQDAQAQSIAEMLRAARQGAEESAEQLRATASQSEALLAARVEAAGRTLEESAQRLARSTTQEREALARSAEELRQQLAATFTAAEASWQERLAARLDAAHAQLQHTLEDSVKSAAQQSAQALAQQAAAAQSRLQEEAGRQAAALGERSAAAAQETERRLAELRDRAEAHTRQLEESAASPAPVADVEQFSSRLEAAQKQALEGFQGHLDEILARYREDLQRRSESLLEETGSRVRSAFQDSSREAATSFEEQMRSLVQPQITSAEETLHRLAGSRSLLEAAATLQEDRVRSIGDEALAGAQERIRETLGTAEKQLQEAAQAVVSRQLADLDAKSSDLKHSTIESLYKSAEWYEKKAQTQLQHLIEKGVEQAGGQLRERAGEVSGVFAAEVDAYSRNFVEHAQQQMEEVVRDAFERSRALFSEAAETTSAAFTDEIQRHARQEIDGFDEGLRKSLDDTRAQAEAVRQELGRHMTTEQEAFLRRFRAGMSTAVEAGVNEAQQQVQGGLKQVLDSWHAMTQAHQDKLRETYGRMGDQSLEQFRGRLENVSNSWMLATVTTLDRQSRDVVTGVAHAAEEKLRETCASVFANVGETLRERLKEIAAGFKPPESSRPAH